MPAGKFISHLEKAVHLIETSCGSMNSLEQKEDTEILQLPEKDNFLLLTLNF